MDPLELKALQAPIKERYKKDPAAAVVLIEAGLHPATVVVTR